MRTRRALAIAVAGVVVAAAAVDAAPAVTFTDATAAAGLTSSTPADDPLKGAYIHAAAWGDPDGDGDADLFVGTFTGEPTTYYQQRGATGPMPNRLFTNDGRGRFRVADQPALELYGVTSGAVFADLDGDGDDDLVVSSYTRAAEAGRHSSPRAYEENHLYRNDRGRFVDVTDGSGIRPTGFTSGRAIGVLDYDVDGCVDLFLVADGLLGNLASSRLLRGTCDLRFTDVTTAAGLASAQGDTVQGLGVAVGDVDGDGLPDLFVAGGPKAKPRRNFLFRNAGDGTFAEVSGGTMFAEDPARPRATEDWTSAASFGDLNRDGLLDLVVSHHFDSGAQGTPIKPRVYLNRTTTPAADVAFEDVTDESGVAGIASKTPHVEIADLDNDGWPDLYLPVLLGTDREPAVYRHTGAFSAEGVPIFESPPDTSSPHYAPGGPLADVDRDGRLDAFLDEWRPAFAPPLYRNTSTSGGWVDVLVRDGPNTDGVGAVVRAYQRHGNRRTLLGTVAVQIGNGYSSASLPVAHLGLGAVKKVDIVVTPPGGATVVEVKNLRSGRRIVVDVAGRSGRRR